MVEIAMTIKGLAGIVCLAVLAGFIGGEMGRQVGVTAATSNVVKASKFELVNSAGVAVATWEISQEREPHLRFMSDRSRVSVDIGVLSDGRPIVKMVGRDGKARIVMELDQSDKPMLGMGDERWEGRMHLGYIEPDSPTPDWDNWGLAFRGFGSERAVAGIGMVKAGTGGLEGFLTVSGKRLQ